MFGALRVHVPMRMCVCAHARARVCVCACVCVCRASFEDEGLLDLGKMYLSVEKEILYAPLQDATVYHALHHSFPKGNIACWRSIYSIGRNIVRYGDWCNV